MDEQTLYGVKACLAFLEHRPHDLLRLYYSAALRHELRAILPWAAARRIPYRELGEEELRKVAHGIHHEGLVAVTKPLRYRAFAPETFAQALGESSRAAGSAAAPDVWMALDRVENPHNLGAILRTCAFFGVRGLLAGRMEPGGKVNAAVPRVAEGGAEHVPLYGVPDLAWALKSTEAPKAPNAPESLKSGGGSRRLVIGLETDGDLPLSQGLSQGIAAAGAGAPLVLVLGQEREGLSPPVRGACDSICALEGGGALESLNVSVAAGVALALATSRKPGRDAPVSRPWPAAPVRKNRPRKGRPGKPSRRG